MLPVGLLSTLERQGYAVFENFFRPDQCDGLLEDIRTLIDQTPDGELTTSSHHWEKTTPSAGSTKGKDNYFLQSSDSVGFFSRPGAFNYRGELAIDKFDAVGRIGYGIHIHRPAFRKLTFSEKTKAVANSLGYKKPIVVQSQYISDAVAKHQDLAYLYVEPPTAAFGVWIALNNNCKNQCALHVIPGSHKNGLVDGNRFVRKTSGLSSSSNVTLGYTGSPRLLSNIDERKFVQVHVPRGAAVILHGATIYKSEKCTSASSPRHNLAYVFHVAESDKVSWDPKNWLQPIHGPFMSLNDTEAE